jgi:hypothetical protein
VRRGKKQRSEFRGSIQTEIEKGRSGGERRSIWGRARGVVDLLIDCADPSCVSNPDVNPDRLSWNMFRDKSIC